MSTTRDGGLFLLLSFLWGTSFMAIKLGLEFMPPVLFAAVRYDVTAVLMLGYVAATTGEWRPRSRADWLVVGVGAALIIALYNAFLFIGQQGVTSGVAAILIAMNPILATGFSRVLLPQERLGGIETVGLLLGFLGVGLVAWPESAGPLAADLLAPAFVLLAAACVALGSVVVQRVDSDIGTEGMVAWSTALGALLLHAMSAGLPAESVGDVAVTPVAIISVAYLAVFASAVGYVIYFELLDRLGAIEINLVSYAVPVFAALSGWLVLDESLDIAAIAGFVVIFVGFLLLKQSTIRDRVWVDRETNATDLSE
ncbi:EamA/RhaT family transporter [Halonotius aquaticus]|uniref:EamA/RhaT family transporter n=1 Tax=Halonotius aquaticus TaxID=2216978 RepID=A0A3A6Q5D1_9EURY|nr:DMT family transporter [Halonotius aquaticus]RJX44542.1 EamA/RhaT family transporter [Halonotius aquaticus]